MPGGRSNELCFPFVKTEQIKLDVIPILSQTFRKWEGGQEDINIKLDCQALIFHSIFNSGIVTFSQKYI